ncbi:MAG: HAD-IIB family hydrolase, partial [Bacteroidaceae bacterium]|nr:HAD-IIB family hydrolase [Bacteroidaceae bacterium]
MSTPDPTFRIIALDLDGTLTNSQKEITPRTMQSLIDVQRRGVRVVLASGRPVCGQRETAEQLQLARYDGYIMAFGGGTLVQCSTSRFIDSVHIPHHLLPHIIHQATSQGFDLLSYQGDEMFSNHAENDYVRYAARINHMRLTQADNLLSALVNPVPKCIIVGEPTPLSAMEEAMKIEMGDVLTIVRSEPFFLEVMPS